MYCRPPLNQKSSLLQSVVELASVPPFLFSKMKYLHTTGHIACPLPNENMTHVFGLTRNSLFNLADLQHPELEVRVIKDLPYKPVHWAITPWLRRWSWNNLELPSFQHTWQCIEGMKGHRPFPRMFSLRYRIRFPKPEEALTTILQPPSCLVIIIYQGAYHLSSFNPCHSVMGEPCINSHPSHYEEAYTS